MDREHNQSTIDQINRYLKRDYGTGDNGGPIFRVVWSEDQFEYRQGEYHKYSPSGLWLGVENKVDYVPKYRQWMPRQWVLEILIAVPSTVSEIYSKLSYEPVWGFREGVVPDYEVVKFLVDTLLEAKNKVQSTYKPNFKELNDPKSIEERIRVAEKLLYEDDKRVSGEPFVGYTTSNTLEDNPK